MLVQAVALQRRPANQRKSVQTFHPGHLEFLGCSDRPVDKNENPNPDRHEIKIDGGMVWTKTQNQTQVFAAYLDSGTKIITFYDTNSARITSCVIDDGEDMYSVRPMDLAWHACLYPRKVYMRETCVKPCAGDSI